jgi:hypothetical protein
VQIFPHARQRKKIGHFSIDVDRANDAIQGKVLLMFAEVASDALQSQIFGLHCNRANGLAEPYIESSLAITGNEVRASRHSSIGSMSVAKEILSLVS